MLRMHFPQYWLNSVRVYEIICLSSSIFCLLLDVSLECITRYLLLSHFALIVFICFFASFPHPCDIECDGENAEHEVNSIAADKTKIACQESNGEG